MPAKYVRITVGDPGGTAFLDGTSVGTMPPTNSGVTALTGHTFSTSGTVPTYDNFVIDDVEQV